MSIEGWTIEKFFKRLKEDKDIPSELIFQLEKVIEGNIFTGDALLKALNL